MIESMPTTKSSSRITVPVLCFLAMIATGNITAEFAVADVGTATDAQTADEQHESEVSRLIKRLGSDSYATRIRAREKLQRMGLEAFDELHSAQFHPDSEIATAARHLVSSLMVSWSKPTDPPEVRDALQEYGAQSENERSSRLERLAVLPDRKGLGALARLARFETSLRLSRRAALAVMQQPMSEEAAVRKRHAELIRKTLEGNDRQASNWLRAYADDLPERAYTADRWRDLVSRQRTQIDTAATQQSTRGSVLELVRVCATRAADVGQLDEALDLARDNLDLIPPTTRDLTDACSWAIDNQLHPIVLSLREQHRRIFSKQPILLYGSAEAELAAGRDEAADRLAEKALSINPIPATEEEQAGFSPKQLEETAQAHRVIGKELQTRGMFRWAEREYRRIIEPLPLDSIPAAMTRAHLATMLSELQRHKDVVDVLEPLIDRIEKDEQLKRRLNMQGFDDRSMRSEVDYHQAMALAAKGNIASAQPLFRRAFDAHTYNVDILIAMFRLEGDDEWQDSVRTLLHRQIVEIENEVRIKETQAKQLGQMRLFQADVAQAYNNYSWLVANTEGDYKKALRFSLKSLELEPDQPAYLDTLARCYFAAGDLENAVATQRRAINLMPHSPPMVRQLEEFEAALQSK